jgi:hypothetical protein
VNFQKKNPRQNQPRQPKFFFRYYYFERVHSAKMVWVSLGYDGELLSFDISFYKFVFFSFFLKKNSASQGLFLDHTNQCGAPLRLILYLFQLYLTRLMLYLFLVFFSFWTPKVAAAKRSAFQPTSIKIDLVKTI